MGWCGGAMGGGNAQQMQMQQQHAMKRKLEEGAQPDAWQKVQRGADEDADAW